MGGHALGRNESDGLVRAGAAQDHLRIGPDHTIKPLRIRHGHVVARLIESLDDETAADALEEIDTQRQTHILENISDDRAVDILEAMGPDEAADLLAKLPPERAQGDRGFHRHAG